MYAHHLVAKTARELAEALYEELMTDNQTYAMWKVMCPELTPNYTRRSFVRLAWPRLVEEARATLAKLLAGPLEEQLKDQIHDALIKDASLIQGRKDRLKTIRH